MPSRRVVFWATAAVAVAAAFGQAWALRWTCDDAFISLRYAEHFVQGHGLVFNLDPNEAPVEGYTNFAWTMWLAFGMWLGFADRGIEAWAAFWGGACHAGTVLLLASIAWRASGGRALVPIAACAFAAIHHAASLAPAGLETASFALLVTALLRFAFELRCVRDAWLAGFVGVLLALSRPDGGLFVAIVGSFVLFDAVRRRAPRLLVGYVVPFLVTFVPYLVWRRLYYGYWVPNTFYAKSAGDPYPSQGLVYLREFFRCYWVLIPVPLLPLVYACRRPDLLAGISHWLGRRPHVAVLAFVLPYLGFIVWVGGDFMFARFVVPVLPALLLGLDLAANRWRPVWPQPALALLLVGGLLLRVEPGWLGEWNPERNPYGVSDNRAITVAPYEPGKPETRAEVMRLMGEVLHGLFDGLPVRIGIMGSQANIAFRSKVPVAIECATGLTDVRIAHQEIPRRGQPGHEKGYRRLMSYLIDERELHFSLDPTFAVGDLTDEWRSVSFLGGPARIATYDRALMRELRRRSEHVVFVDFEAVLDRYLAELAGKDREGVRADYAAFRSYYFDHNDDRERQRRFEDFLR
ncbi:MAG: hypothetical protein KDE27_07250 [Planctomycetes bacterium]|nr:hypothetical protein [Planctomycetota bacterium]